MIRRGAGDDLSRQHAMSLDFQRLARVRARHRCGRKRWLKILSTLVLVAPIIGVSWLAAPMIAGRLHLSSGPSFPPLSRATSLVEAQGWVKTVEPETGFIRVSHGFLGLMSLALLITPDTLIVVGDKEGGFGDIREGGRVKAAYEVRPDSLQAKRVEVFVHGSHIPSPTSIPLTGASPR
jgi:hypothetical protein